MLKKAVITEKTTKSAPLNKYAFEVGLKSAKGKIKKMVEKTYGVHVINIWTATQSGKRKRVGFTRKLGPLKKSKRAIVQLKGEEKIEIFQTGG